MTDDIEIHIGSELKPGTYPGTLLGIEPDSYEWEGEERLIYRWTFALDDDPNGQTITGSTSRVASPRSKMATWIAALTADGDVLGKTFKAKDLIGREALVAVALDKNGYPAIDNVVAKPKGKAA